MPQYQYWTPLKLSAWPTHLESRAPQARSDFSSVIIVKSWKKAPMRRPNVAAQSLLPSQSSKA